MLLFQSVSNWHSCLNQFVCLHTDFSNFGKLASQWDNLSNYHVNAMQIIILDQDVDNWCGANTILKRWHGMPMLMGAWYGWVHKKKVETNHINVIICWVMSRMWVLYHGNKMKQHYRGVGGYFLRPTDNLASWFQLYDDFHLVAITIANYRVLATSAMTFLLFTRLCAGLVN